MVMGSHLAEPVQGAGGNGHPQLRQVAFQERADEFLAPLATGHIRFRQEAPRKAAPAPVSAQHGGVGLRRPQLRQEEGGSIRGSRRGRPGIRNSGGAVRARRIQVPATGRSAGRRRARSAGRETIRARAGFHPGRSVVPRWRQKRPPGRAGGPGPTDVPSPGATPRESRPAHCARGWICRTGAGRGWPRRGTGAAIAKPGSEADAESYMQIERGVYCHRANENQPPMGDSKPATLRRDLHIT